MVGLVVVCGYRVAGGFGGVRLQGNSRTWSFCTWDLVVCGYRVAGVGLGEMRCGYRVARGHGRFVRGYRVAPG